MHAPTDLRIPLGRSALLTGGLVLVHAGAIAIVLALDLPLPVVAALATMLAAHGGWAAWRIGLLGGPRAVIGVVLADDHRCTLVRRGGTVCDGTVDGATLVTAPLIVLSMRDTEGRPHRVVIAPDMAPAETRRRLRVVLRWGRPQPAGARQA